MENMRTLFCTVDSRKTKYRVLFCIVFCFLITLKKFYLDLGFKCMESAHCGYSKPGNYKSVSSSELVIAQKSLEEVEASQILGYFDDIVNFIIKKMTKHIRKQSTMTEYWYREQTT